MLLGWNIGRPLHSSGLFQLCNVLRQLITYWSGIWYKTAEMQKTRRILRLTLQFRPIWFLQGLHLPITKKEILHELQDLQIPSPKIESEGDQVMQFLHSLKWGMPNVYDLDSFSQHSWLIYVTCKFKSQILQEIFGESTDTLQRSQIVWAKILKPVSSTNLRNPSQSANPWESANPWKNRNPCKKCESLRKGKRSIAKSAGNRGGRYRTVEAGAGRNPGIRWRDLPPRPPAFSRPHTPSSSLLEASHHGYPEITASRSGNLSGTFQSLPRECSIKYYPSRHCSHPGNYGLHTVNANPPKRHESSTYRVFFLTGTPPKSS